MSRTLALLALLALPAAAQTTVAVDPPEIRNLALIPATTFEVTISATTDRSCHGVDIGLEWDPRILKFLYADVGAFWDGYDLLTIGNAADGPGRYWIAAAVLGPESVPARTGTLFTLSFQVIALGSTELIFTNSGPWSHGSSIPKFVALGAPAYVVSSATPGFFSNLSAPPSPTPTPSPSPSPSPSAPPAEIAAVADDGSNGGACGALGAEFFLPAALIVLCFRRTRTA